MMVSCALTSFGDVASCTNHDSDNNGLWTAIVVGAEAFRYAVTKDPAALSAAREFYNGLVLLNKITGVGCLLNKKNPRAYTISPAF